MSDPLQRYDRLQTGGKTVDTITKLIWTTEANHLLMTWEDAKAYIKKLNDENHLGRNDWRLPNVKQDAHKEYSAELETLVRKDAQAEWIRNPNQYNFEAPPAYAFDNVRIDSFYWSNTSCAKDDSNAWVVWMADGSVTRAWKIDLGYVWPVCEGGYLTVINGEGSGIYEQRSEVKIKAYELEGFYFSHWSGSHVDYPARQTATVTMPNQNHIVKAIHIPVGEQITRAAILHYDVYEPYAGEITASRTKTWSSIQLQKLDFVPQSNKRFFYETLGITPDADVRRVGRDPGFFELYKTGETHFVTAYLSSKPDALTKLLNKSNTLVDFNRILSEDFTVPYRDETTGANNSVFVNTSGVTKYFNVVVFTPKFHEITWFFGGDWFGKYGMSTSTKVEHNTMPTPPPANTIGLSKEGYIIDEDYPWDPPVIEATEDATYTAQWKQRAEITWNINGGIRSTSANTLPFTASESPTTDFFSSWFDDLLLAFIPVGTVPVPPEVTKEGYTLAWEPPVTVAKGNRHYTAKWTPDFTLSHIQPPIGESKVGYEIKIGKILPEGATVEYRWGICDTIDGVYDFDPFYYFPGAMILPATTEGKFIKIQATGFGMYTGTVVSAATKKIAARERYFPVDSKYTETTRELGRFWPQDGVITDMTTNLMWTNHLFIGGAPFLLKDVPSQIANLNASKYGGYNDWRLPTVAELMAGDFHRVNLAYCLFDIDIHFGFTAWTGEMAGDSAWAVEMSSQAPTPQRIVNLPEFNSAYVCPVRNGQYVPVIPITAVGEIQGIPVVGKELTMGALSPHGAEASAIYTWEISDTEQGSYTYLEEPLNYRSIPAKRNKFTTRSEHLGKFIRVKVEGINEYCGTAISPSIEILPTKLESIVISSLPEKILYEIGEPLDISGLTIAGTYDNGWVLPLSVTVDNITGFNSSTPVVGQMLTVTISEVSTTFLINVYASASGVAIVREANLLRATNLTPEDATVTYQWYTCIPGTYPLDIDEIPGATTVTCAITEADEAAIRSFVVKISGIGAYTGEAFSEIYTLERYRDNGNETVTDLKTGLMWSKYAGWVRTWSQALTLVAQMNALDNGVGYLGYSDWRLPRVNEVNNASFGGGTHPAELDTLGRADGNPAGAFTPLDDTPFVAVQKGLYWSGTTHELAINYAWCVNMEYGFKDAYCEKTMSQNVWLVRG